MWNKFATICLTGSVLAAAVLVAAPEEKPAESALAAAVQLEDAFSAVAEKARPAVVVITNIQKGIGESMEGMVPEDMEEYFFNPFFGMQRRNGRRRPQPRRSPVPVNSGSGAIISPDGYIVTNCHVIENSDYLQVKLADGTIYDNQKNEDDVRIVGIDSETDLAVLQLGGKRAKRDFAYLEFADITKLRVGQWAIAIGAPHQLEQSVTIGNVSQIGRHNMGVTTFDNYIQTDASLNPGNSGGPLLNLRGEIIGINEFIHTSGMSKGNIGLGFAISADLAKQVSDALIKDGEVIRPYLGIAIQSLTPELKKQFKIEAGAIIAEVIKGEAAEKSGLKNGDVVIALNGKNVRDSHDLLIAITAYKPGDTLTLTVLRDDEKLDIAIKAGKRQLADNSFKGQKRESRNDQSSEFDKLGLKLEVEDGEVVVADIQEKGAVAAASARMSNGLREGDVIIDVNRRSVSSVADVKNALKYTRNNTVILLVERRSRGRGSMRFFVVVPLDAD